MALVTFKADVSPYMTGDTVDLSGAERRRVDEEAKRRNLKDVYLTHEKPIAKKETKAPAKRRKSK